MGLKANSSEDNVPDWLFYGFLLFQLLQLVIFITLMWLVHQKG